MNRGPAKTSNRSWWWRWALVAIVSLGTASAVFALTRSPASAPAARPVANQAPAGQPSRPTPAAGPLARRPAPQQTGAGRADPVGALFSRDGDHLGAHFCTASVVTSRSGDLLITAAHCVAGIELVKPGHLLFAPGYASGKFPRGLWVVTKGFTDSRWSAHQDPNDDVAFLAVRPVIKTDGLAAGPRSPNRARPCAASPERNGCGSAPDCQRRSGRSATRTAATSPCPARPGRWRSTLAR